MKPARIHIQRAYDDRGGDNAQRVLIDRLWPRGIRKSDLADAIWLKDVAPSPQLRKWFGHRPERWDEFRSRYRRELQSNPALDALRELVASGPVTLLYGARDEAHNQAVVLAEFLGDQSATGAAASPVQRPHPRRAPDPSSARERP